jgi:aminopeptidase N
MHMLRMMMHDFKSGSDRRFMGMMTDFVTLHRGASASTDDFRQVAEDHLGGPMNWFFDQWVYGTEIPRFKYTKNIVEQEDGTFVVSGRIEQSEVSEPFRVFMPISFDFGKDKKSTFVQEITDWVTTFESPPLPLKPKKVIFNDFWTVLCRD